MSLSRADRLTDIGLRGGALVSGGIVLLVVAFVFIAAWPALRDVGLITFFADSGWYPTEDRWGLWPMVVGSLYATFGAVALAAPLALLSAVFLRFYAPPPLANGFRKLIALLAGIPSVVFGFWGLVVLVPVIAAVHPPGPSLLAAALVLMVMILPTVTLVVDAGLGQVPDDQIAGAHALGFHKAGVIWRVAVPAAAPSLLTGSVLGSARAIGETMAVLMVCGGVVNLPTSVFEPIRTLTAGIALEMSYALDGHRAALFVCGLVLVAVVTVLVAVATRLDRGHLHV